MSIFYRITGLPVKIKVLHPKSEQKIVCTDFNFETEMDDSLFSTIPPEGYDLKEEVVGFKADVKEVTKEQIYQTATRPTYVIANELSWTKKPFIIDIVKNPRWFFHSKDTDRWELL